jgi:CRISPR-associated RAMP protein (TIGR02581 family)
MHKKLVNQCTIELSLIPDGPILIKSGQQGADPTKPDMEFVETYHKGRKAIYLPGSSLKGAIRAQAERIVRTVGSDRRDESNPSRLWASDPLNENRFYLKDKSASEIYKLSCFTEQMFGNTSIASRIRIEDAYPDPETPLVLEERNGVAIDRILGSAVSNALFNYQVCTSGRFRTKIHLKNFSLAQLGLIGLVLRDLHDGWFALGFGKSRGLGTVGVEFHEAVVQYPGCELRDGKIWAIAHEQSWSKTALIGAGELLGKQNPYGFPTPDCQETPIAAEEMLLGFGAQMTWKGRTEVEDLFVKAVKGWKEVLKQGVGT